MLLQSQTASPLHVHLKQFGVRISFLFQVGTAPAQWDEYFEGNFPVSCTAVMLLLPLSSAKRERFSKKIFPSVFFPVVHSTKWQFCYRTSPFHRLWQFSKAFKILTRRLLQQPCTSPYPHPDSPALQKPPTPVPFGGVGARPSFQTGCLIHGYPEVPHIQKSLPASKQQPQVSLGFTPQYEKILQNRKHCKPKKTIYCL